MATEKDTARDQASAQMQSISAMVAALNCDYDRLEELRDEKDTHDDVHGAGDWIAAYPSDALELSELEEAAGNCSDQEDARQRIEEDALSVEVRSAWCAPGEEMAATEYRIVLCTGGPHVEIVGELGAFNLPESARLLYQDWFTGKQEYFGDDLDRDALVTYAQCFYFGE